METLGKLKVEIVSKGKNALETKIRFFEQEDGEEWREIPPASNNIYNPQHKLDMVLNNIVLFEEPLLKISCKSIKYNYISVGIKTPTKYIEMGKIENLYSVRPTEKEIEELLTMLKNIKKAAVKIKGEIESFEKREVVYL